MSKSKYIILGAVVLIIVIVISFVSFEQKEDPVKIGAMFPLTGGLTQYGEAAKNSAQLAADEINENGGISGRKLEIDYQDHGCSPKTAIDLLKTFSDAKNVKILTSAACSGTVLSIAPQLEERQILLVGTIVTTPKITNVSKYVFRNWGSDDKEALLFSREIKNRAYKKIGIIHEETDYATGLKISLEKYLNGSGIEIYSESFSPDSTDIRAQITKLKEKDVEMLFISPQTVTSADIVLKQMEELNLRPELFVNDNIIKATKILWDHSQILEGAVGGDYVAENSTKLQDFLEKYREKYGSDCAQPNICAGVYDVVRFIAQGIKEKGYDAAAVREYLQEMEYNGISGRISFDENNDRDNADYSLFVVRNGKAVLL